MNPQTYFQAHSAPGLDLVAACVGKSAQDFAAPGIDAVRVAEVLDLTSIYFGETAYPGIQQEARRALAQTQHTIDTLLLIEAQVKSWRNKPRKAWRLRATLCLTPAASIKATARKLKARTSTGPAEGVRVTRRKKGNHTLSMTASPLEIATILGKLKAVDAHDRLAAIRKIFQGKSAPVAPEVSTNVIVDLGDLAEISAGKGDDIVLSMPNGGTMTGAQLVAHRLAEHGFVTLVHPVHGAVNAYRLQRFANDKQRLMLSGVYPRCVWPDCNIPAEECQFHHIKAWVDGGYTNVDNLAPLCKYHNGINEDSGPADNRGKIVKVGGKAAWQPPWGGPPVVVTGSP
ncbi:hypothetical protein CPHO_09430 [Corynebacterium phocae]|uniref:HNH nuclease domain-containing protein n=1 Tax=Corynebacterium phocae TaxID=161895 RepID=A0A1L7D4I2_9CORY|nr:HNH endonuclease signature motif containing protein [Corynebacterium phocae]APT93069.1 hypothetical protein CPHO_09430 [Corynebacterium phocae]